MTYDASQTIQAFLQAASSKQPAPGGGSVTALVGALCAAVGEMVLNYSVGKKDIAQHEPTLREALGELTRARAVMLELMVEDQAAFEALSAARKAAKDARDRDPTFAAALLACIRIPQAVGATGVAILELTDRLAPIANKFLLSDLAVCAELAMATVRCASHNVRINLPDITDPAERGRFESAAQSMVAHAGEMVRRIIPAIWKRIDKKT
jgi:formiminotetrahydrofolate cyclodeaminase